VAGEILGGDGGGPLLAECGRIDEGDGQGGFFEVAELAVGLLAAVVEEGLQARRIGVEITALRIAVELGSGDGARGRRRSPGLLGSQDPRRRPGGAPIRRPGLHLPLRVKAQEPEAATAGAFGKAFLHQGLGFLSAILLIARPGQQLFCVLV